MLHDGATTNNEGNTLRADLIPGAPMPRRLPKDAASPEKVAQRILQAYDDGHSGTLDLT